MRRVINRILAAFKKSIFVLLIFITVLGTFPLGTNAGDVQAQTAEKTTVRGVYDFLHEDYEDGTSRDIPYLFDKANDKATRLNPAEKQIPENYIGDEISVTGILDNGVLSFTVADNSTLFSLTAAGSDGEASALAASTGTNSIAIFYVNFVDYRERTMSYEGIHDYVFDSYKNFLDRSSNGLFTVSGDVYFLDLPINKTCELISRIGLDGDLIRYTKQEASNLGINVDSFDHKIIVIDKNLSCDPGPRGKAYRPAEFAYSVGVGSIAHELGHLYGLDHAGAYDCATSFVESTCEFTSTEYWNYMDIMGGSNEHINGDYGPFHKHKMGWLQGSQIINVTSNGTFTLERFEDLPGAPGPLLPTKVLRIRAFDGGPAYYVSHRRKWSETLGRREGVTIELASGDTGGYKRTALLDTTPGTQAGINDFYDGYLHDGQKVTDPFNGIVFEQISHDTNNAVVRVSFVEPSVNTSFMDVKFIRATGYLSALGRKQNVEWSPVTYVVSLECTSTFLGCPANLGDKITTKNTSGNLQLANGFSYEYTVDIYTKKDGDPNSTARYFWYKASKNNVSCPNGASTCSINVSWPAVTYKTSLVSAGTNTKVCAGELGCQDFIATSGPNVSFRGLIAIDGNTNLEANVEITDFSNNNHLLERVGGLGKPDDYSYSCSSYESMACEINTPSGIGPFIGNEPILVAVKVGDENGHLLSGPVIARASADGSYSRNWVSSNGEKAWDYHVIVFPNDYSDCLEAAGECEIKSIYDTENRDFTLTFSGLKQNYNYRVIVCAMTCNSSTGNTKMVDTVIKSANVAFGPSFFPFDPFNQSIFFSGEYYDNPDFTNLKMLREDEKTFFNWGEGSPHSSIDPESFSVRWTGNINTTDGEYRFNASTKDKVKVFIDGNLIMDNTGSSDSPYSILVNLSAGNHQLKVEYVHQSGSAAIVLSWAKASECFDFNGDLKVSSMDLSLLSKRFGVVQPGNSWDLNKDNRVSSIDLGLLAQNFGSCN